MKSKSQLGAGVTARWRLTGGPGLNAHAGTKAADLLTLSLFFVDVGKVLWRRAGRRLLNSFTVPVVSVLLPFSGPWRVIIAKIIVAGGCVLFITLA